MWAIRNKRTRKWLYGTDYRHYPPTQRTSENKAMLFETCEEAEAEMRYRKCGLSYKAVPVILEELC